MLLDAQGSPIKSGDAKLLSIMARDYARRFTALQYYRTVVPMQELEKQNLAYTHIDIGMADPLLTAQAQIHCDVLHMYAFALGNAEDIVQSVRAMKPTTDDKGILRTPPVTVFDVDDNHDYIHPFNHSFEHMGYRTFPSGKMMGEGDNITTVMPDGKEISLWEDGVTIGPHGHIFNVMRNRESVASEMRLARLCSGVTVPSTALAGYFRTVQKCKNVHIFPNTIVPSDWRWPDLAPRTDKKVRILWQGGNSHFPDWFPLREAMREVCLKYPQVEFVLWGEAFGWITDVIPPEQLVFEPFVPYDAYRPIRSTLQVDINLAPLANNLFNRCKSAIKWYEASIGPRPIPTLASNVQPYNEEMVDGVSGLLFSDPAEFVQKLSLLIENADLRRTLAEGARNWVMDNRTPEHTIPPLYEFYQELRAQRRAEYIAS